MNILQRFFAWQVSVCKRIDASWFGSLAVDGNTEFVSYVRSQVLSGQRIADIGGGKTPFFAVGDVKRLGLSVVGVDIEETELSAAPEGAYELTIVSAIEVAEGGRDCDCVIAQSVLEHVYSGAEAVRGIRSFGRQGALVYTFCPSRRAWFARLNMLLPEALKRKILFSIFPSKRDRQGYPAHYDGCTPDELVRNMESAGVKCVEVRHYFASSYFMFFVPLYLTWRLSMYPFMRIWPSRYCETFMFVGRVET